MIISAASFISTQINNTQTTEEILTAHESLIEIFKNPLYATMIAATELTLKLLEMEPQMRIKHIFDSFIEFHKKRYFNTYPDADKEEYNEILEQLTKYALKFLDTVCQIKLKEVLGIDCNAMIPDQEELEKQWLKMGLVQCLNQERINERIEKINFLHQTFAEYHAAMYVAKHAILIRIKDDIGNLLNV